MQKPDTIFWSLALVAALYLVADFSHLFGIKANAQQAAPAKGMSCGMNGGGGCGCGAMMPN